MAENRFLLPNVSRVRKQLRRVHPTKGNYGVFDMLVILAKGDHHITTQDGALG